MTVLFWKSGHNMKKTILRLFLCLILMAGSAGCTPQWSEDRYEVLPIFSGSQTLVFIKTSQGIENSIVTYTYQNRDGLVTLLCTIHFEQGMYLAGTVFCADTLQPVTAHKSNTGRPRPEDNWEILAEYGEDILLRAVTSLGVEEKRIERPERLIDHESMVIALGALKMEEGFRKVLNISIIEAGKVIPYQVRKVGREQISVPLGIFDCIKVEVRYAGPVIGIRPRMHLWYQDSPNRLLIRYEFAGEVLELAEVK